MKTTVAQASGSFTLTGIFTGFSPSFCVNRPVTAPAPRQENIHREFSLDMDGIEGDELHDVAVPTLETNEALDDLISAPVHKPYTK